MSTMVGAPRTPACRRADRDREAHGDSRTGTMGRCPCPSPAERDSGDQACPSATREPSRRPAARTSRPRRLQSRRHDRRSGVPVADRTCPHWPNSASRQAAGSSMRKTYSAILFAGRGAAESVSSSAVLDHDHAETIVSEGTVQPDCRSDQRVRAKRPASHGQRPARPAPSGRTPARGPSGGNTWTEPFHGRFNPSSSAPNPAVACSSFCAVSDERGPGRWPAVTPPRSSGGAGSS